MLKLEPASTGAVCRVCGGEIVEGQEARSVATPGVTVRPGIWEKVSTGTYCLGCGLEYRFVPAQRAVEDSATMDVTTKGE